MNQHLLKSIFTTFTLTTLTLSAGCDSNSKNPSAQVKPEDKSVTFWQDVAPITYQYCGSCHVDGGAAPFVLTNYEATKFWASAALEAITEKSMPPWLVTSDGSCGDFSHSRWLPEEKITVFKDWLDSGMLEGTPRTDLKVAVLPTLENATTYKTPNFTPVIAGGALAEYDEYRCFLVNPNIDKDQFITGYDVHPGNAPMVHHSIVFTVDTASNAAKIAQLEAESPDRDGWSCFGGAGEGVNIKGIPVSWAPGQGAVNLPANTGFRVAKGDALVIQMHYNLENPSIIGESDQTEIKISYVDSVPREGFTILPDEFLASLQDGTPEILAPGMDSVKFSWQIPIGGYSAQSKTGKIDLYGILPHMHERGKKMSASLLRKDGSEQCVADVQNWDFEWQLFYFYNKPIEISSGDILKTTCDYDTSEDSEAILPGWGTRNEMCLLGAFLVPQ